MEVFILALNCAGDAEEKWVRKRTETGDPGGVEVSIDESFCLEK